MKIVIDARLYGLENAGLGRYVINLVDKLKNIDTENSYIILLRKKYYDSLVFPKNWKKVRADFRHYSIKEQLFLPVLLYFLRADVVHFPHFNVPILYFGKYVVTIHDLIMHKFKDEATTTLPKMFYLIRRFGYYLGFSVATKRSSKIIVPTEHVKHEVQLYYPDIVADKIAVTYEGGPEKRNVVGEKSNVLKKYNLSCPYFIYYGNAYPHKNLKILFEAISNQDIVGSNIKLFLSTPRSVFSDRLEKTIEKIDSAKKIIFPGYVEDEELSVLLAGSVGFIYPSLEEGFGLQGLEALSAGTLTLVSDIPVFREVYGDRVLYFDPNNPLSLVSSMKRAVEMKENERNIWISQGKEHVKNYSWDKMAQETLKIYNESCNSI